MNRLLPLLFIFLSFSLPGIAQVDTTIGLNVPKGAAKDYRDLAHTLCDGLSSDQEKANAIYNWITHNIRYDIKALNDQKALKKRAFTTEIKAEKALSSRKAVCEGYSMLFSGMCREAGLHAVNIVGYSKDWIFDNGDSLYIPRHMWSAVMVNGQWWPVDVTWGAGGLVQAPGIWRRMLNKILHQQVLYAKKLKFKFKYDPQYFMQDPEAFRLKHLPSDPQWQLTDSVMPLQLFEAGDSAIRQFNALYSKPKQDNPELLRISDFDEKQKLYEYADRAYNYNSRYPVVLALKRTYAAASEVEKAFTDSTVQDGLLLINDAQTGLQRSQALIKQQKTSFSPQYSRLKKKNTAKNQEAKQYIRLIKTDDKRLIAECKKYTHSAGTKTDKVKTRYGASRKRANAIGGHRIVASKVQKKAGSSQLTDITDSLNARKARFLDMKILLDEQGVVIKDRQAENAARLDSLAKYLVAGDSILIKEAISRINMHDNYDDEVISLSRQFKTLKYQKADTLQKHYLIGYDTVVALHERRQKQQIAQMDLFKSNLRSLEQYRKWNSQDTVMAEQYNDCAKDYADCINYYNNDLAAYSNYIKANRKLFSYLAKLNRRQVKIVEYMDRVETRRKRVEEKTIEENKAFDIKENERQQYVVKNLQQQLQKISDKAIGK